MRCSVTLRAWCSEACRLQVRLRVPAWVASRLGVPKLVGVGAATAPAARSTAVTVRLLPAAARRLTRLRGARVTVETQAYDLGGALRQRVVRRLRLG
jgi:hypothetical protein